MADEMIQYVTREFAEVASETSDPQHRPKAVLLSKNSLMAAGLKYLLEGAGFAVSGIVTDETLLPIFCSDASCRLAIIDGNNPTDQVVGIIRGLRGQHPQMRVLVIADTFDLRFVQMSLDAGVAGFCSSGSGRDVLIKSIELVTMGETILPAMLVRQILSAAPQPQERATENGLADPKIAILQAHRLSAREAEILICLMQGASNKIIARNLDVSEATIKVHIKAILRKIRVANRTQAAMWAAEHMRVPHGASLSNKTDGLGHCAS